LPAKRQQPFHGVYDDFGVTTASAVIVFGFIHDQFGLKAVYEASNIQRTGKTVIGK